MLRVLFQAECRQLGGDANEALNSLVLVAQEEIKRRVVLRLVDLTAEHQGKSREASALRREYRRVWRQQESGGTDADSGMDQAIAQEVYKRIDGLARQVAQSIYRGTRSASARGDAYQYLVDLCKIRNQNATTALESPLRDLRLADELRILDMAANGRPDTVAARRLQRTIAATTSPSVLDGELSDRGQSYLDDLAEKWVEGEHGGRVAWNHNYDNSGDFNPNSFLIPGRRLSPGEMDALRVRMHRVAAFARLNVAETVAQHEEPWTALGMARSRAEIVAERQHADPEATKLRTLEDQYVAGARSEVERETAEDRHVYYYATTASGREAFARDRLARIAARIQGEQLDAELSANPDPIRAAALRDKRCKLAEEEQRLRVRMGDPLVTADFPADARAVVALMPDGTTMPLNGEASAGRWQVRFDVPTTTPEGDYTATVVAVLADGSRKTWEFKYSLDVTPPTGSARVTRAPDGALRLEVVADSDTRRVVALLPGDMPALVLGPIADHPGLFFGLAAPGAVPGPVTFVLTDRAHNRTTLSVAVDSGWIAAAAATEHDQ